MSELPNGWTRATLDAIADVLDFEREPINSSERNSRISGKSKADLYPYYGATGQVGFIDSFRSEGHRVLLGEDAAPFLDPVKDKAYLANGRFWVNNHAHVLAGAAGFIDNRYLCHQLNTVDYHPFVTGTTRLKLTSSAMRQIPMVVAPAAEQTRIVEKLEELLSDLDAGVAELKAAQKKLGQYRQSLLKAAVEGALTADWRESQKNQKTKPAESGAQLLKRILQERRTRWEAKQLAKFKEQGKTPAKGWQSKYAEPVAPETAGMPELPKGWVWASLDSLIDEGPQNGLYLPATLYGRGCPMLRIDDFQIGWARSREKLNLVDADAVTVATYALRAGDLVINRVNSMTHLGKSLVVSESLSGVLFESNMMRSRLLQLINSDYVGLYLGSELGRKRLTSTAKWAVNQASINQQDVKKTPVPISSFAEQCEIAVVVGRLLMAAKVQAKAITHSLKQASAQRKNILKAAFSGQLVPQDPQDEPASALLARIRAQRVKQGALPRVRKSKIRKDAHA